MIIEDEDKGIYIINDYRTAVIMDERSEIDRLMKESQDAIIRRSERKLKRHFHEDGKSRSFKINTQDFLFRDEYNDHQNDSPVKDNEIAEEFKSGNSSESQIDTHRDFLPRLKTSEPVHLKSSDNDQDSDDKVRIDALVPSLDSIYVKMLSYKANSPTDVIDSHQEVQGMLENHIIVCGYKEGLSYYIKFIRNNSDVPILIIADEVYQYKIKSLYIKSNNVFYLKGVPTDINLLKNANLEKWQHVLILSHQDESGSKLDIDGVVISNYLQEKYPHIPYSVEVMNQISIQLILYSMFANINADLDPHLSLSFITGKVLDSTVFYKLSSSLRNNPLNIDFVYKMTEDIPGSNKLIPIHVTDYLKGKVYRDVYKLFLTDPQLKLLWFGVFSWQMGKEINQNITEIFAEDFEANNDSLFDYDPRESQPVDSYRPKPAMTREDLNRWLLK